MRRLQKLLSVFLAIMMVLSIVPITASAASSGSCGENLTWNYNFTTYTLTISGTGDMKNYSYTNRPWESYEDKITTVVVGDGVTSIGAYAFYSFGKVTSITIPDSVTKIGITSFNACKLLTTVALPEGITAIPDRAFTNCTALSSITIPANVTTIGASAFEGCSSLTNIVLPNGVTSIGDKAFGSCTKLTNVTVPANLTSFNATAFTGCSALAGVTVDADNTVYSSDEFGVLFNKDKTQLIKYFAGNTATSYTIPDSVTSIASGAFSGCTNLTEVIIPDGVKTIDSNAFSGCTNLTEVIIPDSVKTIESNAFAGCTNLTSVTIPAGVTKISTRTFENCNNLANITIPDSVTTIEVNAFIGTAIYNDATNWENNILYIGDYLITANSTIRGEVQIKDGTKVIAEEAFYGCTSVTSISIPNSVTTINKKAFNYCSALTSIVIPDGITTIGTEAFAYCSKLEKVTIPLSVKTIETGAFDGCKNLKEVYYSGRAADWFKISIGEKNDAIIKADVLSGPGGEIIVIPGDTTSNMIWYFDETTGVLKITGRGAMENFKSNTRPWESHRLAIREVIIDGGITTIGDYAFYNCYNLKKVTLPAGMTTIGMYAFYCCNQLTDVTLPDTITSIGYCAFSSCGSMTSINLENVKSIGELSFYGCRGFTSITISDNTTSIGRAAFASCANVTSIYIGKNVASIAHSAFGENTKITSFVIDEDNPYYFTDGVALYSKDKTIFYDYVADSPRESYTMIDSVTTIKMHAFDNCENLTKLTLSSNLNRVESEAFWSCMIKEYYYPRTEEWWYDTVKISRLNDKLEKGPIYFAPTDPEAVTGKCGENLIWTLNSVTGDMVITGTGAMYDYDATSRRSWEKYLSSIKNVVISDGATTIGSFAFYNCTNLETINIPGSVETIGDGAFKNCNKIASITVDKNNNNYSSDKYGVLFNKDKTTLICYPKGNLQTTYTVPSTVKTIEKDAFKDADNVKDITISEGVTTIGESAFEDCDSLENITFPSTITSIGDYALRYSNPRVNSTGTKAQWREVVKHEGDTYLEGVPVYCTDGIAYPFGYCGENVTWEFNTDTKTMTIAGTGKMFTYEIIDSGHTYIDERPWLVYEDKIENVVIEEGVTSIGGNAFQYCENLTYVTIPLSVENVYDSAFYNSSVLVVDYAGTEEDWSKVNVESYNEPLLNAQFIFAGYEPPASGTCGENLTWTYDANTGTLTISGTGAMDNYTGNEPGLFEDEPYNFEGNRPWEEIKHSIKKVIISEGVTSVGESAFRGLAQLHTVEMADSVTVIGANAFRKCNKLSNFVVSDGVETIGVAAFVSCSNLAIVTIPDTVTTIGYNAFNSCDNLKDVYFLGTEEQWEDISIGGSSILGDSLSKATIHYSDKYESDSGKCGDNLTWYFDAQTRTLTISGTGAMYDYDNAENKYPWNGYKYAVKNIVISKDVTTIGNYAFYNFKNVGSIRILADLTSIGNNAFYGCVSLTAITIPDTVTSIGEYAFYNCLGLESITIPDGVTLIKRETFAYCKNLKNIKFPDTMEGIYYGAFYECDSLTTVVLPEGIPSLNNALFYRCDNLTTVTIPGSVTIIGWDVFYECSNLETVYMGRGVTAISPFAFYKCNNLKDVYYAGTEKMWNNISISEYNTTLGDSDTTIHFTECKHLEYTKVVTAPTCTEHGYTTYTCIGCDDTYVADYVDANGHSLIDYEGAYTAPTCTENGSKETISCCLVCNICLATETTDIAALGHTPADAVEENYVVPTCTTDGSKDVVVYCSVCGEEISRETVIIEKLEHTDDDGNGYCDACDELLNPSVECECNCHKGGFSGFIWSIKMFFSKIFRTNEFCECGATHY